MQDTKPNWPIRVGGEYQWEGKWTENWRSKVTEITADGTVHFDHIDGDGRVWAHHREPERLFRGGLIPEDQSPIPALVKVLKAIQFKGHNQVCPICKGNESIGHGAMCDINLALALAGESEKESEDA